MPLELMRMPFTMSLRGHCTERVEIGEHVHAVGAHADAFHNVAAWALHREGGNW